jgi:spore coat protein U-like protein
MRPNPCTLLPTGALAAMAIFLPAAASAQSQVSTSQLKVTLAVQAECKLTSTTDLAFGTTGVIQTAVNATGTIGVQCTNTTPYNIGLNAGTGSGATVSARKMTSGSGSTITYDIYRDTARTQVWGDTVNSNTLAGTGNGAVQTHTVYGRVPAQATPAPGSYSDTVTVTVTY